MLTNLMLCTYCRNEIPPESFKLFRNDVPEEIECPHCRILNDIYMARCRANDSILEQNVKKKIKEKKD